MDGISSASPIAFLGSVLAHAAFGVAVIGFGQTAAKVDLPQKTAELVFFESVAPVVPEPASAPVLEEPTAVRRVARVVPSTPKPVAAPEPTQLEPVVAAPVVAPETIAEATPTQPEVNAGVSEAALAGSDAKGFAAGSAVGAKTGNPTAAAGSVAGATRGVIDGTADRSRAAGLADGRNWACPFPQEADDEGIESARVTLQVEIGVDGSMQKAVVVSDPGFGFGQEARRCAMRRRWVSQLNRTGAPVAGRATVVVNFVR